MTVLFYTSRSGSDANAVSKDCTALQLVSFSTSLCNDIGWLVHLDICNVSACVCE